MPPSWGWPLPPSWEWPLPPAWEWPLPPAWEWPLPPELGSLRPPASGSLWPPEWRSLPPEWGSLWLPPSEWPRHLVRGQDPVEPPALRTPRAPLPPLRPAWLELRANRASAAASRHGTSRHPELPHPPLTRPRSASRLRGASAGGAQLQRCCDEAPQGHSSWTSTTRSLDSYGSPDEAWLELHGHQGGGGEAVSGSHRHTPTAAGSPGARCPSSHIKGDLQV